MNKIKKLLKAKIQELQPVFKAKRKLLRAQVKKMAKEMGPSFGLALAITLVAVFAADLLYQEKKMIKRGYKIEISATGKVVKKEEKPVDLATMMKTADFDRGAKAFKKCASCHTAGKGEAAKVGPNLYGIIGRARASFSGFSYSEAMKSKGGSWDSESINTFITKPKDFVPGTKMAFPGLKKPQDRADVILFLQKQK
jgi:cytochrome c